MTDGYQLSFDNALRSNRRINSKLSNHLPKLNQIIDWQPLALHISIFDKTDANTGRGPRRSIRMPTRLKKAVATTLVNKGYIGMVV